MKGTAQTCVHLVLANRDPNTVRTYDGLKVRFSAAVGEESEIELALV